MYPFDGDKNLVNAKNTPVVLLMAIAASPRPLMSPDRKPLWP